MSPEFYDFDTGRWDFDWLSVAPDSRKSATYTPSSKIKFDMTDLLIIKELQMDANRSLKEMADKLQVNYKKLAWHHTTHVLTHRMLSSYILNWMGTRYDYNLEKALHRKHRYFALDVFVRNVNEMELMTLRSSMNRIPFLWSEAAGRDYFAEFALPVDNVVEGLHYLGKVTSSVRTRTTLYPMDQTEAARFTVPYKLYDPTAKAWTFNEKELTQRFESLLLQIKEGAS